jgi:signal transduction histidine kinase
VVQESLSNARKHSNASRVRLRLRSATAYAYLRVSDDGPGSDAERTNGSERLELVGVVEGMQLLGGNVEIEKAPGGSLVVRATLSCWRPVENLTTCMDAVT